MTEYEAYQEHIRYTHDTYCRIVIRHASFDAARMLAARWKREISLEYLTEEKFVQLSTTDEYFQVPDYGETYPFSVRGQTIFYMTCPGSALWKPYKSRLFSCLIVHARPPFPFTFRFLPPVNSGGTAGTVFRPVGLWDEHSAADRTAF